jgi:hypothetical protein
MLNGGQQVRAAIFGSVVAMIDTEGQMRIRWPNFHLASFLDAYYHSKNRMMPGLGRSSAGLATDRLASPMPIAPQPVGLPSTSISSSSRSDQAGWFSNHMHTSSPNDDGSEEST